MNLSEYKEQVGQIPYGKRLPTALYVHREGLAGIGGSLRTVLDQVIARYQVTMEFNLVKFRTDELKISFLAYPEFLSEAHPALRHSVTIDLATGKARHTDYANNINPPILHRKESFVPADHPRRAEFEALTKAEEEAGLYEDTATIGFKLNWERLLQSKGLVVKGHQLEGQEPALPAESGPAAVVVERHKTALTRYDLSKPVKSLLEYGVLKGGTSFFDYGCGQGSDVKGLQGLGYQADGWDPVFRPDAPKREADVVNLGYVVNVIEDPAERLEALVDSYRHARRLLVVSALINETVDTGRATQFQDGVLTRWNTFQKYFEQQEIQQYIEDALETTAVPVSLGVFYVFRDPAEQQDFLSARSRRAIDWTQISARLGLGGPPADRWEALYSEHKELLDAFGSVALSLGRLPGDGDFKRVNEVAEKLGSLKRGLRALVQGGGAKDVSWGSRLSSWLVDWKALDSGCADDFAIGGHIQSFEYLVVGHSFLAEKFPLLLHEAVRVQEHGNGALLLAGGRVGWVLESCSGWLLRLHLELGLVRAGACQYSAFSGITNRTPPLGSGTSPA